MAAWQFPLNPSKTAGMVDFVFGMSVSTLFTTSMSTSSCQDSRDTNTTSARRTFSLLVACAAALLSTRDEYALFRFLHSEQQEVHGRA